MKRIKILLFLLVTLLAISCADSSSTTEENKSEETTVDEEDFYKEEKGELQLLIENAKPGDTLKISPGTYYEIIYMEDIKDLVLDFTDVKLLTKADQGIFWMERCSNISIKGLTLYHEVDQVGCFTNCFDVSHCENIKFEDCDINGSGFIGICVNQSMGVDIKKCKIHKCTAHGVFAWCMNEDLENLPISESEIVIENCTFDDNNGSHVAFDPNYLDHSTFKVTIDGKEHIVTKENYKQYEKEYYEFNIAVE